MLSRSILKLRGFSIYKYYLPLFRNISYYQPLIYLLIIISIVQSSLGAMGTNHIKQIIAYSSIVHMNLRALRLFSNKSHGVIRGLYCMLSHNFISSGLSIIAETLYNRYQSYYIKKYSSLSEKAPVLSLFVSLIVFSNISTPLTANFIGKFLIFMSISKENVASLIIVSVYILITAAYSLFFLIKILYGGVKI